MTDSAVAASYEQMAQDAMDGNLPAPVKVCEACSLDSVPFALHAADGPHGLDATLGIPSIPGAATADWLTNNPWIKDQVQNVRDTYLLRVLDVLATEHPEAYLAELHAFMASQKLEFCCLDDEIEEGFLSPAVLDVFATRGDDGYSFSLNNNFCFFEHKVYFATFTRAAFESAEWREDVDEDGNLITRGPFEWTSTSGLYSVLLAAKQLAQAFEKAKQRRRVKEFFLGALEAAGAMLCLVPFAGAAEVGTIALFKGVRYTFLVIDRTLSANALIDGSSRMIRGEGLDLGETMFESLGKLANPTDGAERGRQVYMAINLAMLAPTAFGTARWILRNFRRQEIVTVRIDTQSLTEAERKALGGRSSANAYAVEIRLDKRTTPNSLDGKQTIIERPSLDANQSQFALVTEAGKANVAIMATTLRGRLVQMLTLHAGNAKVVGRLGKVVGDAGEEAFAAVLIEKWKVDPKKILGYSTDPAVPSRLGLSNKSGHGLDILLYVPPPPSITIRNPIDAERRLIDGTRSIAPTKTLTFTEQTLLVIETKATLGGSKTPKFNRPQAKGGASKMAELQAKILRGKGGWTERKMREMDANVGDKLTAIRNAQKLQKIEYLHAQVFFDHKGQLNRLVGGGTGIQLNTW
ncbi:hypothetical protein [Achromobacter spanius]|uniref:hypothetical protein n=1 Tax=Achromobacter spanius TaxID=217203 RepID=UPI00320A3552